MKRTRDFYDDDGRRARAFLVKVCDYGVVVLLLAGVVYSTYLDIEGRFRPSDTDLLTAKRVAAVESTVE